jgi:hypothetical protein
MSTFFFFFQMSFFSVKSTFKTLKCNPKQTLNVRTLYVVLVVMAFFNKCCYHYNFLSIFILFIGFLMAFFIEVNQAKQREDEVQGLKMRLRFREAAIKRLEAVASGKILAETHLLKEKEEHLKEIEVLRAQVDRNHELTRFAMENLRLKEEIRRCVLIFMQLDPLVSVNILFILYFLLCP